MQNCKYSFEAYMDRILYLFLVQKVGIAYYSLCHIKDVLDLSKVKTYLLINLRFFNGKDGVLLCLPTAELECVNLMYRYPESFVFR
jgi:hypothetical protein